MRFSWDEKANDGLSRFSDAQKTVLRDAIINWGNGAGGWNPARQNHIFNVSRQVVHVTAERTAADQVTVVDVTAD
jgi:hypothetical protein